MTKKILKATHDGILPLGDLSLPVAVLEEGTRVVSERGLMKALGGKRGGSHWKRMKENPDGAYLPVYVSANNLKPFISDKLSMALQYRYNYRPKTGGGLAYGLDATLIPEILDVWLKARDAGALKRAQYHIAEMADALMRSFAKVGIVALIDEVTGYQEDRARDELQTILRAYISEELLPWTARFPTEFYKQMFRLKSWPYPPFGTKGAPKGPRYAGKLTKELIYKKLPGPVIYELESKNPPNAKWQRKHKHHQWLTDDIGNPHLEKQVAIVTTL